MASCTRFYDAVILRFFIALYTMWCCAGSESVNSLAKFNTYVRTYVDMFFFNWGQFLMYYDSTSTYMPCSTYVFSTVPLFITPIVLFHIFRFQNSMNKLYMYVRYVQIFPLTFVQVKGPYDTVLGLFDRTYLLL